MKPVVAVMLAACAAPVLGQANPPPTPPPPACESPEHGQFDFWVGRWNVYQAGRTKLVARSHIEKLYAGCAIRENWMPVAGTGGGSLNAWVPDEKRWRQVWLDSSNAFAEFHGGYEGETMRLAGLWRNSGGPGMHQSFRITWSRADGGKVRQFGETTADKGKTWQPSFDFLYVPAD